MGENASGQPWLLVTMVILWIAVQYGLAIWALRDLWHRPRVRGDNKVLWALLILIVPVLGPLLYSSLGPASFLPRPNLRRPTLHRPSIRSPILARPGFRHPLQRRPGLRRPSIARPDLRHVHPKPPRKQEPPSGA